LVGAVDSQFADTLGDFPSTSVFDENAYLLSFRWQGAASEENQEPTETITDYTYDWTSNTTELLDQRL
jgi:hypothetical protein